MTFKILTLILCITAYLMIFSIVKLIKNKNKLRYYSNSWFWIFFLSLVIFLIGLLILLYN